MVSPHHGLLQNEGLAISVIANRVREELGFYRIRSLGTIPKVGPSSLHHSASVFIHSPHPKLGEQVQTLGQTSQEPSGKTIMIHFWHGVLALA